MNIDKNLVKSSFSRAALTYNSNANIQQIVAKNTISLASKAFGSKKKQASVLDIGCGTGFIKQEAAERGLEWQFTGLDISSEMCGQYGNAICGDMENMQIEDESHDYCISSLAFQWASDLEKALQEMYRVLKPGGKFVFSTFINGTLEELKQSFAKLDNNQHVLNFANPLEISMLLQKAGFNNITSNSEKEVEIFTDAFALMKHIKTIGASLKGKNNQGYSRSYFENLNNHYKTNYSDKAGIYATWQVAYFSGKK